MALPHISNSKAGFEKYDPAHNNMFEVYFTLPSKLQSKYGKDTELITQHVTKVTGLGAIHRAPGVGQQKFMGTDRSFINPKLDSTHAEIQVDFTLNLRNGTDNYIYKIFKDWAKLGYDIATGARELKKDYVADWLRICIANRHGDVYEDVIFKDVMMDEGPDGLDEVDYDNAEALTLSVKFVSDWWVDVLA